MIYSFSVISVQLLFIFQFLSVRSLLSPLHLVSNQLPASCQQSPSFGSQLLLCSLLGSKSWVSPVGSLLLIIFTEVSFCFWNFWLEKWNLKQHRCHIYVVYVWVILKFSSSVHKVKHINVINSTQTHVFRSLLLEIMIFCFQQMKTQQLTLEYYVRP